MMTFFVVWCLVGIFYHFTVNCPPRCKWCLVAYWVISGPVMWFALAVVIFVGIISLYFIED